MRESMWDGYSAERCFYPERFADLSECFSLRDRTLRLRKELQAASDLRPLQLHGSQKNPAGMLVVSVFIAMLERGANAIQTQFKIPASAADLLIGIILFFMLGCEFFITYKLIGRGKEEHHA